jgi:hypothetical protein
LWFTDEFAIILVELDQLPAFPPCSVTMDRRKKYSFLPEKLVRGTLRKLARQSIRHDK